MTGKTILVISGVLGAAGILIGAFGAHALPKMLADLSPEQVVEREAWLQTGVTYHMYHVVALLALGLFVHATKTNLGGVAMAWLLGILIFSGCLYAMTLTGVRVLGAIVPIGGVSFVVGWVLLTFAALRLGEQ